MRLRISRVHKTEMDGIKPNRGSYQRSHASAGRTQRAQTAHTEPRSASAKVRHSGKRYWLIRSIGKTAAKGRQTIWATYKQSEFARWPKRNIWRRAYTLAILLLFMVSTVGTIVQPFINDKPYHLSEAARAILPKRNVAFGQLMTEDYKQKQFIYNQGGASSTSDMSTSTSNQPRFSATFGKEAKDGIKISDTMSQVDFTLKPKFPVMPAQKQDNQLLYKLNSHDGVLVYTSRTASVKEDIILESYTKDEISFEFELGLQDGLEARLEQDGSLGVYGSDLPINGNVATSTDQDAELLQKVRTNAKKTKLLFTVPAPVVLESNKKPSKATSKYELDGNTLKIVTTNLKQANYPLSIDPTVYVETAAKLMRGNNETNTDFDVENELIQKSQTTGARIDAWTSTNNLGSAVWAQGTAVAGGYIYSAGGRGGTNTTASTYYSAGTDSFSVPAGVTTLTVKVWGAGGAGGGGNGNGSGGRGGGGGYVKAVINVTPGESLDLVVGAGGVKAATNTNSGGGGGYSSVLRGGTTLLQAGGGGGGGGTRGSPTGGAGGGGGTSSATSTAPSGSAGSGTGPGGAGAGANTNTSTPGAGGTAGTGGVAGSVGALNAGGNGAGAGASCTTAVTNTQGSGYGGGGRGSNNYSNCPGGGGGGGGRYGGGGGGGSSGTNNRAGGGGGGGSSYINPSGLVGGSDAYAAGSGATAGNSSDSDRSTSGNGGSGGIRATNSSAGSDGGVVISYTTGSTAVIDTLSWAKFNTTNNAIESPNPGNGACSGWCSDAAYKLPTALKDLSLVAYNSYLYAMGGNTGSTYSSAVYIAKIGANGEPQLWHPTDTNKNNWVYWYTDTSLSAPRSQFGAVAYNNRMYIIGGLTTGNAVLSSNTVQYADIKPMGTLTAFTATGMQALSGSSGGNRYGVTAHAYNDTIYVIGGDATFSGAPVANVDYAKLNADGTMNPWVATAAMGSGKMTVGGSYTTVFGGYMYANGGCAAVDANGYCSSISSTVQISSINADGSLAGWNTILTLTNDRFAHTTIAWQGGLYRLGGCRVQDPSTGSCTTTIIDVDYGVINPAGEASTVATSSSSGTGSCDGTPYNCDLPGSVGNMLNAVAIAGGYLYIMGGCTNNACTSFSSGVTYQAIGSDGSLQKPATCTGTYSDAYCVSSSSLPEAVGAPGVTVFGGRIYVVGGFPTISDIYYITVNSDGSLGTWQSNDTVTGATTAADAVSYPFAYSRANPGSAGSSPGNLYIFGGCSGTITNIGCSGYSQAVYKCDITTDGSVTGCSTTNQLQIGTVTGASGTGLGAFTGAVYANYIYMMGGLAPGVTDLTTVRYAKFDDNNNVVTVGSGWVEGANNMNTGRRRGAGFGYNGYLYVLGGYDGSDAIADIEFAKLNVSDGSWETFDTSSVSIQKRWALTTVVSNSYAYVIGGCVAGAAPSSCSTRTNSVQTFQIYNNDSGTPAGYSAGASLFTTDRMGASSAVLNGYLYIAGGCISPTDCTDATNNVQYTQISPTNGSLVGWSNASNVLPAERAWGQLQVVGGNLYYIGGQDDTATNEQSTIYYANTFSSGNITAAWASASGGIGDTAGQAAQPRTKFGATVWNNRIYVVGGLDGSSAVTSTVYISPQLSSGGNIAADSWTSDADIPDVARFGASLVAYANNLYLLGGNDGTNYLSDVQFAQINTDGTVDAWVFTTSLPTPISQGEGFAANGYIYLVGGRNNDYDCAPSTLVAPISANTTIATGNNPTGVGEWYETNARYTGDRYGAAVTYYGGKIYAMGGACQTGPVVTSVTTSNANTESTTNNVTMPATVESGDLLLALFTNDGSSTVTTPAGWTLIGSSVANGTNVRGTVYAKIAAGTEDGTNVNFVTSANEKSAAQVYRILAANWYGDLTNGVAVTGASTGSTATPNPSSLDPANWDTEESLWIAYIAGSTYSSITSAPSGYGGNTHVNTGTTDTTGASASSAYRVAAASSEDPGTFTLNSAQNGVAMTIAVRPANTYTGANRVVQTALLSQPQVAKYSRMIDTDTDVFPTSWLLNGVDNSIGARWQVKYRTMHDIDAQVNPNEDCGTSATMPAMTTWGQETNFGDTSLGIVNLYTPKNSSGGNINCARYYYFSISIDASQTFGYPEDVNRGPTISDISLFFTSDPSKRMRYGKTFTGGEQQPLDTPCRKGSSSPGDPNYNCPLP